MNISNGKYLHARDLWLKVSPRRAGSGTLLLQVAGGSQSQISRRTLDTIFGCGTIVPVAFSGRKVRNEVQMDAHATNEQRVSRRDQWRPVEVFSEAKDRRRGSEDAHIVGEACIAVFDGVSSPSDGEQDGPTPGQYAVEAGARLLYGDPDIRAHTIVQRLTQAVRIAREGYRTGTPSFVFVAFFPKEDVIVRVGDCSYLIDGEGSNKELAVDHVRAVLRKRIITRILAAGASVEELLRNDPAHARMAGLRDWQDHFTNTHASPEYSYGVIDGEDVPERFVEYIPVPCSACKIVLASDGYSSGTLKMTLQESEKALVRLQEEDPLGIARYSVRSHKPVKEGQTATDDRTYIRIERI